MEPKFLPGTTGALVKNSGKNLDSFIDSVWASLLYVTVSTGVWCWVGEGVGIAHWKAGKRQRFHIASARWPMRGDSLVGKDCFRMVEWGIAQTGPFVGFGTDYPQDVGFTLLILRSAPDRLEVAMECHSS